MLLSRQGSGHCLHARPCAGLGPGRDEGLPCCGCSWFPGSGSICLALLVPFSRVGLVSPKPQRGFTCWGPRESTGELGCVWLGFLTPGDTASTSPSDAGFQDAGDSAHPGLLCPSCWPGSGWLWAQ